MIQLFVQKQNSFPGHFVQFLSTTSPLENRSIIFDPFGELNVFYIVWTNDPAEESRNPQLDNYCYVYTLGAFGGSAEAWVTYMSKKLNEHPYFGKSWFSYQDQPLRLRIGWKQSNLKIPVIDTALIDPQIDSAGYLYTYQEEEIELSNDLELPVTFSNTDALRFNENTSPISQEFEVWHTVQNARFFDDAFSSQGTTFDFSFASKARFTNNGRNLLTGSLRVQSSTKKLDSISYQCIFTGDFASFASSIGQSTSGEKLNSLDLRDLDHTLNYSNIQLANYPYGSTSSALLNQQIVYPLIEWGYVYDSSNNPVYPTISTQGVQRFTQISTGLFEDQLKPAIKVKTLFDKIVKETGYTYTSNFLENNEDFTQLYYVAESGARPSVFESFINDKTKSVNSWQSLGVLGATVQDPYIVQNQAGQPYEFEIPFEGTYRIQLITTAPFSVYNNTGATHNTTYKLLNKSDNQEIYTFISLTQNPVNCSTFIDSTSPPLNVDVNLTLNPGRYRIVVDHTYPPATFSACPTPLPSTFSGFQVKVAIASPIRMNYFIDPDQTKQEFVEDIIRKFNLIVQEDPDDPFNLKIEPWINWVEEETSTLDWSQKVDRSQDIVLEPFWNEASRYYKFSDQEDNDYLNDRYQIKNEKPFGQQEFDTGLVSLTGNEELETSFGTSQAGIIEDDESTDGIQLYLMHLCQEIEGNVRKVEPIVPKPRLLYWNGLTTSGLTWYLRNGLTYIAQTQHGMMTPYKGAAAQDLTSNWANELPQINNIRYPLLNVQRDSMFSKYWSKWTESYFSKTSQKLTCYVRINDSDIQELKFNRRIWIEDNWYYLTLIEDYLLGQENVCKCEFVKAF